MGDIVIGIPNNGQISSETCFGLFHAIIDDNLNKKLITRIVESQNLFIDVNRNAIVEGFLNYFNDDWLLFIDSDVEINLNDIYNLYDIAKNNNLDILGGVYFYSKTHRSLDLRANLQIDLPDGRKTDLYDIDFNEDYLEVSSLGTGAMLISRRALIKTVQFDKNGRPFWFKTYNDDGTFIAEDVYFCNLAKNFGIKSYACPKVTVNHIKLSRFTKDDFIRQQGHSK